ncbi:RNA polymerase sigma factor [Microbacterium sp.]|uniref:RNA polymerase sigma factor n=1 Tax=Microbacterium sp. TaxID=51671 RepID=UPI003A956A5F
MDNSRAAFEAVFVQHHAAVLRFVERRVDDRERAKELTMDCFEIAWRKFDPAAPVGLPWLLQTARNLVGNVYRRRDRERAGIAELTNTARDRTVTDEREHRRIELEIAMAALRADDREVLQLVYWDGLSADEAATVLACRPAAVWKRLSRARTALRGLLEDSTAHSQNSPWQGARIPKGEVKPLALE